MTETTRDRWDHARVEVIARWRSILERIDAHDEGDVLRLANTMDEFCEEADFVRYFATHQLGEDEPPFLKPGAGPGPAGGRCLFCRVFAELGGCAGLLRDLNRAVLAGDWDKAHRLAADYITRLEGVDLSRSPLSRVH